ncbi:30S ribosomal protein S9 [Galdieria sulphuraria]|nr:30S ribosomal protein S9 [Galdieria sulphuraria]
MVVTVVHRLSWFAKKTRKTNVNSTPNETFKGRQNLISDITTGGDSYAEKRAETTMQYVKTPDPGNPWEHPFQAVEKENSSSLVLKQVEKEPLSEEPLEGKDEISLEDVDLPKIVDEEGRSYGIGARKTSTCEVWLKAGSGNYLVNGKPMVRHFRETRLIEEALEPLLHFNVADQFDADCYVVGGGQSGQAGALKHGIAHALKLFDPAYYPELYKLGYLLRDSRMVEPKKIGRKKARKQKQWSKR